MISHLWVKNPSPPSPDDVTSCQNALTTFVIITVNYLNAILFNLWSSKGSEPPVLTQLKQMSQVIWQKAASPSCHPPRGGKWIRPILTPIGSLGSHKSPPNGISIGSAVLCAPPPPHPTHTHRHTDIQTYRHTDHATCNICSNRPHLCTACKRRGLKK